MLLDLGRNDAGRVSEIGTVKVTDQFFIEHYSQVMHIVSNVEGTLSSKHDSIDALAAGFPAGTVSGAPKVRAMEIIDELEKEKRGLYAGAVGYFSAAGEMDTAIVLRTALVKDGMMYVQAGAGIVADSNPKSEQTGMRQQGQGAVPRRRGGQALRQRRRARAVVGIALNCRSSPRKRGPRLTQDWIPAFAGMSGGSDSSQAAMLFGVTRCFATPGFHHLHLNSVDPDAAIDFYVRQFPSTSKTTWNGFPALKSPTNVLILFSKVAAPPPTSPQTAIWHFGWHVVDSRKSLETYKARPDVEALPALHLRRRRHAC